MEKAPTGERGDLAGEGEFSGGGRTVGEEEFHRRRVAVAAEGVLIFRIFRVQAEQGAAGLAHTVVQPLLEQLILAVVAVAVVGMVRDQ